MTTEPNQPQHDQPRRIGVWMVIAMWMIVIWLFTAFFAKWYEHDHNPNQQLASVIKSNGVREVVLQRNRQGHYVSSGFINNIPVTFMLDTGASDISIPARIAEQLGLKRGVQMQYQTANGAVWGYSTVLSSVAIGDIELHDVRASINPNVNELDILLGMSFLKHIDFSQRGNTLTLRQLPN